VGPSGVEVPLLVLPAGAKAAASTPQETSTDGLTERSPLAVAFFCWRVPEAPPGQTPGGVLVSRMTKCREHDLCLRVRYSARTRKRDMWPALPATTLALRSDLTSSLW